MDGRVTMKRDEILLEFPLCCLAMDYIEEDIISHIISYCVVRRSHKIDTQIEKRIEYYTGKFPEDFNPESETDCQILLASKELGLSISTIQINNKRFSNVSNFIQEYEYKYGKDAYCRIGKNLLFETRDGKFQYKSFTVLCAIQSIIGKRKPFTRIIKDRIRYRMVGYKSKDIAHKEMNGEQLLLTDRQLGTIINFLYTKQFFSKFTYARRQTFYSTRLTDEELREEVKNMKIYFAKKKSGIEDDKATKDIKSHLRLIKHPLGVKSA